jgi:hypothetical protein
VSVNRPSEDKKARLAEALRANLKRRKMQARARSEALTGVEETATPMPQSPPKEADKREG